MGFQLTLLYTFRGPERHRKSQQDPGGPGGARGLAGPDAPPCRGRPGAVLPPGTSREAPEPLLTVQQASQRRLPMQEHRAGEPEAGCDRGFAGLASCSWRGHEAAEKVAHPVE